MFKKIGGDLKLNILERSKKIWLRYWDYSKPIFLIKVFQYYESR